MITCVGTWRKNHCCLLLSQWLKSDVVLKTPLANFVVDVLGVAFDRFVGIVIWKMRCQRILFFWHFPLRHVTLFSTHSFQLETDRCGHLTGTDQSSSGMILWFELWKEKISLTGWGRYGSFQYLSLLQCTLYMMPLDNQILAYNAYNISSTNICCSVSRDFDTAPYPKTEMGPWTWMVFFWHFSASRVIDFTLFDQSHLPYLLKCHWRNVTNFLLFEVKKVTNLFLSKKDDLNGRIRLWNEQQSFNIFQDIFTLKVVAPYFLYSARALLLWGSKTGHWGSWLLWAYSII